MTAHDVPALAAWIAQVPLWQRYGLNAAKARRQLQSALQRQDVLLVAQGAQANEPLGFAWVMPQGGFGRAYLRLIGVHPAHSGQGLGAALLQAAEHAAAEHGAGLFLLVSDFNTAAQRFYRRHGYRQVGALAAFVLPNVTELIFYKALSSPRREGVQ